MHRSARSIAHPAVVLGAFLLTLVLGAPQAHAVLGDCNNNGVPDASEAAWANRDDDGDGVCNGVDNCPLEPNADQLSTGGIGNACTMRAITVPMVPTNPSAPHLTYSGATITLMGIARYGGDQFMWDYGDGTVPAMPWTAISSPLNLGVKHAYLGSVGQLFIAKLKVRSSANPIVESIAEFPVKIDTSSALPSDPNQMDVRASMAIEEGLWYLHVNQTRSTYVDGTPGYQQPYGYWAGGAKAETCAALDAFQLHGSKPLQSYNDDPYVETTRRALSYVLATATYTGISAQPAGNPDTNGNGAGIYFGGNSTYADGICGVAVASSGAPGRVAGTGTGGVHNRAYKDIIQDVVDWFAYGQTDPSTGAYRGGWLYSANSSYADGSTNQWPILAMSAAEENMGSIVPAYVRSEMPYFMNQMHNTTATVYNGGYGYTAGTQWPNIAKTAGGLLANFFLGRTNAYPDVQAGLGMMYRRWSLDTADWTEYNLGDSYAMYGVMKAMQKGNITKVFDYNYTTGTQTTNSFDWYYTPAGQAQQGLASNIVSRQAADGSVTDNLGPYPQYHYVSTTLSTAWDILILAKAVTLIPPKAAICNCTATWDINSPITLDGSCSSHADASRSIRHWDWDYAYNGSTFRQTIDATGFGVTGQKVVKADGFATYTQAANGTSNGTTHPVALRVTDDNPLTLGGPQTAVTTCNVIIKPPPHCPSPAAGGPYLGSVNTAVQLSAAASLDVDQDPITFKWDFLNNAAFSGPTIVNPTVTFSLPGTYPIAVQVTDHPSQNAVPYVAPECSMVSYTTVEIGAHKPVANPGGPYSILQSSSVTLDGSASSDFDNLPLTYAWDLQGNGLYTDSTAVKPTFSVGNVPVGTPYTVCLKVSNGSKSASACTTVTVIRTRTPPICTIVSPNVVKSCTGGPLSIAIDGSRSYDLNGDPLTFAWTTDCPAPFDVATNALTTLTFQTAALGCTKSCVAHLTVSNTTLSSTCDAAVNIVDDKPPAFNLPVPKNVTFECDPNATANVNAWLASAGATDACAPAGSTVALSNDFVATTGCGGVNGSATVTWTAQDVCSANTGQVTATVTVRDSTPPVLTLPANLATEATQPGGAVVTFTATALDYVSGATVVTCTPASGSTFPVGATTVSCTTTDAANNAANGSFVVTITDVTPPVLTLPGSLVAEAIGPAGAPVSFTATATDLVDGVRLVTCTPASGSTFSLTPPLTTVTCTAADTRGNTATGSFSVTVQDLTPPVVTVPANLTAEATGPAGAVVTFSSTASDLVDGTTGTTGVTCTPASGSTFAIATTPVTCARTDAHGNTGTASFTVTVQDTTKPVFAGAPTTGPLTLEATGPAGAPLASYGLSATDLVDGTVAVSCTKVLPQTFAIGSTPVSCSAMDLHGNTAALAFDVNVVDTTPPVVTCPANAVVMANGPLGAESWGVVEPTSTGLAAFFAQASSVDLVDPLPVLTNDAPALLPAGATTTVKFTSVDAHGNSASCAANVTVTVEDQPLPVLTCPANLVLSGATTGQIDWTAAFRRPVTVELLLLSGAGTSPLMVSELAGSAARLTSSATAGGSYAVRLRATDEVSGSSVECNRFLSVQGAAVPVALRARLSALVGQ